MMRCCPKCGAYSADGLLTFCLVDGTPLLAISPESSAWSEGVRVLEEGERSLRKQRRKLRWRRIVMGATTMVITTMVVCVVAVNGWIYLKPNPDRRHPQPPYLSTLPGVGGSIMPNPDIAPVPDQPTLPGTATLSPDREPSPSRSTGPSPSPDSGTPTPSPTLTLTMVFTPTPTPTPTPPTPTPTPTPSPTPSPSPRPVVVFALPSPSPTPSPECSDADASRIRTTIFNRFTGAWQQAIEGERNQIVARYAVPGVPPPEASLGEVGYDLIFVKPCKAAVVRATYTWQVRTNLNGTVRSVNVPREKRFACGKVLGAWFCS